jgi:hypothetical protein
MANVGYAIQCRRSLYVTQNAAVVLLSEKPQLLLDPVFYPEFTYFFLKFKRAIICSQAFFRSSFEFGGHLSSHCTRKHFRIAPATYNLYL